MKKILTIIVTLTISTVAFSQSEADIKKMVDVAVKMFTWDIEKVDRGALMFLDVPYQRDKQDSVEYLTLTVAKDKKHKRPEFISMIVPSNVVKSNGIFLTFGNMDEEPTRVHFERCDEEICTARIIGGFVMDEETNEKVDIFQKFLDYDHVYFMFIYSDGSHKSVAVPLSSFKEQYGNL